VSNGAKENEFNTTIIGRSTGVVRAGFLVFDIEERH
jgi:hypothetical protein